MLYRRKVGCIHVSVRKAGNQSQWLIDAFRELYPCLLQTACVNRSYTAQQKWVGDGTACGKNFGRTGACINSHWLPSLFSSWPNCCFGGLCSPQWFFWSSAWAPDFAWNGTLACNIKSLFEILAKK